MFRKWEGGSLMGLGIKIHPAGIYHRFTTDAKNVSFWLGSAVSIIMGNF